MSHTHPSLDVPGFGDGGDVAGCHQHAAVNLLRFSVVPRPLTGVHHSEELLSYPVRHNIYDSRIDKGVLRA